MRSFDFVLGCGLVGVEWKLEPCCSLGRTTVCLVPNVMGPRPDEGRWGWLVRRSGDGVVWDRVGWCGLVLVMG